MHTEHPKTRTDVRLAILAEVSRQITSILDIDQLLVQVVRLLQQTFDFYHVGIGLVEADEVVYRVGAGALCDDRGFRFTPGRLKIGVEGITGWVAQHGVAQYLPDAMADPRGSHVPGTEDEIFDTEDLYDAVHQDIDLFVDAGYCPLEPTTLLDLTGTEPVVLRMGQGVVDF